MISERKGKTADGKTCLGLHKEHRKAGSPLIQPHPVPKDCDTEPLSDDEEEVDIDARNPARARLLAKVYEVDPLIASSRTLGAQKCLCLPSQFT